MKLKFVCAFLTVCLFAGALFIGELVLGGIVFILNYVPRAFRKRD